MVRALAFSLLAATASQQSPAREVAPQAGTASIAGVVIAAADKQPIGYARVMLNNSTRITYANGKGEFVFPNLPAGRYAISAQANGYLSVSLGQTRPGRPGVAQVLAAGEERKGVVLSMRKGGVVSGRVVGADSRPLAGVDVWALRTSWSQSGTAMLERGGIGKSDDRGDYRISGLVAGTYLVEVLPPTIVGREDNQANVDETQRLATEGLIPTFYPGTIDPAAAASFSVELDAERAGVDFFIQPAPMWTVSGRVDGVVTSPLIGGRPGQVAAGALRLRPSSQTTAGVLANSTGRELFVRVNGDGRFRFDAVPPGLYSLLYSAGSSVGIRGAYGMSEVTVTDRDVDGVSIVANPAAAISGEIVPANRTGKSTPPPIEFLPLAGRLGPLTGALQARSNDPAAFGLINLEPGSYAVRPSASSAGVYLLKVEVDGAPVQGTRIEIGSVDLKNIRVTYSIDIAEVSGNVRHEDLSPVTEYALVVFPADKREWPVWMTGAGVSRADSSGRYTYSTRPGSYLIAAVEDVEQFQWLDPKFLESLIPTATKITLGPGQKLSQDFVVK